MGRVQVNTIFFPYWVMVKIFDSFTPINNTVIFSILNQFVGSTQQNSNTGHDSLFSFRKDEHIHGVSLIKFYIDLKF